MIPLIKLFIGSEEIRAVKNVLLSKQLSQGPVVEKLEKEFSKLCNAKFATATSSGTSALHTALYAVGIGPGDEVITTSFTFVATANAILMVGAKPVFIDIEQDSFNIDPKLIENKITRNTKVILPVDLYGQPANYSKIIKIARKHNLSVIQDAAQSIGAKYNGKPVGSFSDITCFSLYASKNITSGEGGMIVTNKKIFDQKARSFRHHGESHKKPYDYLDLGYNYRMMDIQAAIAIEQLKRISFLSKKRQEIASNYDKSFKGIKGILTPQVSKDSVSVYHQYTLRITNDFKISRDKLQAYLEKKGIQTSVYYPLPLYRYKHLAFNNNPRDFPNAEKAVKEIISIPVHPLLTKKEVNYIINTISKLQ